MASLLLRNVVVTSASFLHCKVVSRSFSWLPGRLRAVSLLQAYTAPKSCPTDPLPFLARSLLPNLQPVASLKCKAVLKKRCKDCFFVRRKGRMYVYCKTHPRHKQRKL